MVRCGVFGTRADTGAPPLPFWGNHAARPLFSAAEGSLEPAGGPLGRWVAAWAEASQAPLAVPPHDAARATAQPEARLSHERPTQLLLGGGDPEAEATAGDEQEAGRGGGVRRPPGAQWLPGCPSGCTSGCTSGCKLGCRIRESRWVVCIHLGLVATTSPSQLLRGVRGLLLLLRGLLLLLRGLDSTHMSMLAASSGGCTPLPSRPSAASLLALGSPTASPIASLASCTAIAALAFAIAAAAATSAISSASSASALAATSAAAFADAIASAVIATATASAFASAAAALSSAAATLASASATAAAASPCTACSLNARSSTICIASCRASRSEAVCSPLTP